MVKRSRRNSWGRIDELPSGRYRASYLHQGKLWNPPRRTFATRMDATAYLQRERALIDSDRWTKPSERTDAATGQTVAQYAAERIAARTLSPRTRKHYESLLRLYVEPTELGRTALTAVTPEQIEHWHAALPTAPTARAHAYGLVHSVFADAVRNRRRDTNPCTLASAQNSRRKAKIRALTPKQLVAVADAAGTYRVAVLVAGTCGLRAGEVKGLQRNDIAPDGSTVRVVRGVTFRSGEWHVGDPKTEAGKRVVSVPEFVRADLVAHMTTIDRARTAQVFPSLTGAEFLTDWEFRRAVERAGRSIGLDGSDDDHAVLRPHELRHTAATLFARSGATTADLMARIGHTTAAMAMRYQHATEERDAEIAAKMSAMFDAAD